MVFKEKKLAVLIYLLRYGRMTDLEVGTCLNLSSRQRKKDFEKLCEIPGIYTDGERSIIYSFFYILSHRIPVFYDHKFKAHYLKDIKTKSPPINQIDPSSNETLRAYFT